MLGRWFNGRKRCRGCIDRLVFNWHLCAPIGVTYFTCRPLYAVYQNRTIKKQDGPYTVVWIIRHAAKEPLCSMGVCSPPATQWSGLLTSWNNARLSGRTYPMWPFVRRDAKNFGILPETVDKSLGRR